MKVAQLNPSLDLPERDRSRFDAEVAAFRVRIPDLLGGYKAEVAAEQVVSVRQAIKLQIANLSSVIDAKAEQYGPNSDEVIAVKAERYAWQDFLASYEE